MNHSPEPACLTCQMPGPPAEQTCTLGRDYRVGFSAGCPSCGRLTTACEPAVLGHTRQPPQETTDMTPAGQPQQQRPGAAAGRNQSTG